MRPVAGIRESDLHIGWKRRASRRSKSAWWHGGTAAAFSKQFSGRGEVKGEDGRWRMAGNGCRYNTLHKEGVPILLQNRTHRHSGREENWNDFVVKQYLLFTYYVGRPLGARRLPRFVDTVEEAWIIFSRNGRDIIKSLTATRWRR